MITLARMAELLPASSRHLPPKPLYRCTGAARRRRRGGRRGRRGGRRVRSARPACSRLFVLRVPVALTVQESASPKGRVRASVTGVIPVEPPEVVSVSLPSVQVAVQAVLSVLVGAVRHGHADADRGRATDRTADHRCRWPSVVDVLDALQKPARVGAGRGHARGDRTGREQPGQSGIKQRHEMISASSIASQHSLCPPSPHGNDALASALVYTRFTWLGTEDGDIRPVR